MATAGFSADVYVAALEPPTFQVGGQVFVGVLVSADEWWKLQPKMARAAIGESSAREQLELMEEMTNLSFPRPWWAVWRRRVWYHVSRLPWAGQLEAVASFTAAQATANNGTAWARERMARAGATSGPGSPS